MELTKEQLLHCTLLLTGAVLLVFAPDAFLPMLARSFMMWWACAALIFALWHTGRRRLWAALCALFAAGACVLQVRVSTPTASVSGCTRDLRVVQLNVLQPNVHHDEVIAHLLELDADVVALEEVDDAWAASLLMGLAERYPHHRIEPRRNCYGITLFSKLPFVKESTLLVHDSPFLEVVVDVKGTPTRILAVHAASPGGYVDFVRRNEQLRWLAHHIARGPGNTVVVGDLNTVHWDDAFSELCLTGGLRSLNSLSTLTWPSVGPFVLIPLDHVLVSAEGLSGAAGSFSVHGSDHRGLLVDIVLADAC